MRTDILPPPKAPPHHQLPTPENTQIAFLLVEPYSYITAPPSAPKGAKSALPSPHRAPTRIFFIGKTTAAVCHTSGSFGGTHRERDDVDDPAQVTVDGGIVAVAIVPYLDVRVHGLIRKHARHAKQKEYPE